MKSAAFVGLALLSVILHSVRLAEPREVVFDEFHFGPYLNSYLCTGGHYFDIHPPHPKLLMTVMGKWVGYDCSVAFGKIGSSYGDVSPTLFRAVPAFFGTLLPLLVFWLMRLWKFSWQAAMLGGLAVCLDNGFLIQSRLILLDVFLLFGTIAALCCYQSAQNKNHQLIWAVFAGFAAALALGTKFSGALAIGMIVIIELQSQWSNKDLKAGIIRMATFAGAFCALYAFGWYLHWQILDAPGSGDLWFKPTGNAWQDTWTAHQKMLSAGIGLDKGHQDQSRPWTWFAMHTPIYYWQGAGKIYFLGNPVVWWGGSIIFFAGLGRAIFKAATAGRDLRPWWQRNGLPLIGFAAAFLPLLPLSRPLFLYHFLTPMLFLIMFSAGELASYIQTKAITTQRWLWIGLTATIVVGFTYIAPFTFGINAMMWLPETIFSVFPTWR